MKKTFMRIFAVTTVLAMLSTPYVNAEGKIKLVVGGELLKTDVAPIIVNDRTMVPVRAAFEAIGAKVSYDAQTRTITAAKKGYTVKLTIDSDVMLVNGTEVKLDAPAFIEDERTLVPLRACSEAFGLGVEWIDKTRTVKIKKEVSVPVEFSNSEGYTTKYSYDENGNCVQVDHSDGSWEKYEYDEFGNRTSFESSIGYWIKNVYNEDGIIVSTDGAGADWEDVTYDENGNVVYVTNGYRSTKYEYNDSGKVIYSETKDPDEGDYYEQYSYDIDGRCTYIDYSGGWKKMTYNDDGNLVLTEESDGSWEKVIYDDNNNLIRKEHSSGNVIEYTYDEFGNCTYEDVINDSVTTYWIKYTYDEKGNLIEEDRNGTATVKYEVVVK